MHREGYGQQHGAQQHLLQQQPQLQVAPHLQQYTQRGAYDGDSQLFLNLLPDSLYSAETGHSSASYPITSYTDLSSIGYGRKGSTTYTTQTSSSWPLSQVETVITTTTTTTTHAPHLVPPQPQVYQPYTSPYGQPVHHLQEHQNFAQYPAGPKGQQVQFPPQKGKSKGKGTRKGKSTKGRKGEKGQKGEKGEKGDKSEKGEKGEKGATAKGTKGAKCKVEEKEDQTEKPQKPAKPHHGKGSCTIHRNGHQSPDVKGAMKRVPCVVTYVHWPKNKDAHLTLPSGVTVPNLVILKPATHCQLYLLPKKLFLRPPGDLQKDSANLLAKLKVGDKVICDADYLSNNRFRPNPETLTLHTIPSEKDMIMTHLVRKDLDKILKESAHDRVPAESLAEQPVTGLGQNDIKVLKARARIVENHPVNRLHQRSLLLSLYTDIANAATACLQDQEKCIGDGKKEFPADFVSLLKQDLFNLLVVWGIENCEHTSSEGFENKLFQSLTRLRDIMDPVLSAKDLACLHARYRWLMYGAGTNISEEKKALVRAELDQLPTEFHRNLSPLKL